MNLDLRKSGRKVRASLRRLLQWTMLAASLVGARAASVTLAWDANQETNIVAYKIYSNVTITNSSGVTFGSSTSSQVLAPATQLALTNLVEGATYSFYATALNANGLESGPSTTLKYTPPFALQSPLIRGASLWVNVSNVWTFSASWAPSWNALGYGYRVTATNGWASAITWTTNTSASVSAPSMPILFELWATNAVGSSAIASMRFARPEPVQNLRAN